MPLPGTPDVGRPLAGLTARGQKLRGPGLVSVGTVRTNAILRSGRMTSSLNGWKVTDALSYLPFLTSFSGYATSF